MAKERVNKEKREQVPVYSSANLGQVNIRLSPHLLQLVKKVVLEMDRDYYNLNHFYVKAVKNLLKKEGVLDDFKK